ncbi:MAG: DUF937 domain-containing protein [Deltaproteobacteria bacterium]|nr:DUF937 domain-containing protein [Deltaproteobacteria bacterium]
MTLQDLLQQADDSGLIDQMAQQLGIDSNQARQGMAQLAPAVARGIQRSAAAPQGGGGGLQDILQVLGGGAGGLGGVDGNAILGQIFGSKDVSRNVAGHAAEQTGLDSSLLRQMLPLVASAAMMILSQQSQAQGARAGAPLGGQAPGGSTLGMLNQLFDADGDGSAVDDLLNMARRFF